MQCTFSCTLDSKYLLTQATYCKGVKVIVLILAHVLDIIDLFVTCCLIASNQETTLVAHLWIQSYYSWRMSPCFFTQSHTRSTSLFINFRKFLFQIPKIIAADHLLSCGEGIFQVRNFFPGKFVGVGEDYPI